MADDDAPASGEMVARLRRIGRVLAALSLLFGGLFVMLARRSAALGEAGEVASGLFWAGAFLQFALAFLLLWRGRRG